MNKARKLIQKEIKRQRDTLNLIPSENIASKEVIAALGTPLTNKYSEGFPGRRYYGGNSVIDEIELYAQEQGLKAFGLSGGLSSDLPNLKKNVEKAKGKNKWFLNVQSYSGSPANMAIYFALAEPGDKIMGLQLANGGHLTHGHPANFSAKFYNAVQFTLDEKTGRLDYDKIARLAKKHKPKIIVSGATAYPRFFNFKKFGDIAKSVGAYHVADVSHIAGLIATGDHPSPFPHSNVVMATTHKTMRGPRGAVIYSKGPQISFKINKAIIPGLQGGPHNHQTASIAVMFEEMQRPAFKKYSRQVVKNAKVLESELKGYGFKLSSGGTDNHLLLIDLKNKEITGTQAENLFASAGIISNRNTVPGDDKPFRPTGVRIGSPAVTSRGMKEREMRVIARLIHDLIDLKKSASLVNKEVRKLCKKFPLPY